MADDPDLPDEETPLEHEFEWRLHLAELDAEERGEVAIAIHQVTCSQVRCTHGISDISSLDVRRAEAAIAVMRRLETRTRWQTRPGDNP